MLVGLSHEQLDWHVDAENIPEYVGRPKGHHACNSVDVATDAYKERVGLEPDVKVLGCSLWGDMAPFLNDGLMLVLVSITTGEHNERIWISVYSKRQMCCCGCQGRCTMEDVLALVKWSFEICLHGVYPDKRHDDVPFANPKKRGDRERHDWFRRGRKMKCRAGIVWFKPDWAHLKQFCDLTGWRGEGENLSCCPRCLANKKTIPADDCSSTAKWKQNSMDNS